MLHHLLAQPDPALPPLLADAVLPLWHSEYVRALSSTAPHDTDGDNGNDGNSENAEETQPTETTIAPAVAAGPDIASESPLAPVSPVLCESALTLLCALARTQPHVAHCLLEVCVCVCVCVTCIPSMCVYV